MDPSSIELENLSKSFEFFKFCSEIDSIEDMEKLKDIAKCYFKLYLKQQEVVLNLGAIWAHHKYLKKSNKVKNGATI